MNGKNNICGKAMFNEDEWVNVRATGLYELIRRAALYELVEDALRRNVPAWNIQYVLGLDTRTAELGAALKGE